MEEEPPLEKGIKYLQQSQYGKAVTVFDKLIESEPDNSDAYKNRGLAQMNLEAYDKAISDFERTLELTPNARGVHSNIGVAWYYKKEYPRAVSHYDEELALNPKNHFALFNRAISLSEMGENDRALTDITRALELKSNFYLARCLQGDLYLKLNRFKAARKAYGTALSLDSNQTYAQEQLSVLDAREAAVDGNDSISVSGMVPPQDEASVQNLASATVGPPEGYEPPSEDGQNLPLKESRVASGNDAPPEWNYSPPKPRVLKKGYALQVGAFQHETNAAAMEKRLEDKGYDPRVLTLTDSKGGRWFLVRLGYFARKKAARNESKIFNQMTGIKAIVRPIGGF